MLLVTIISILINFSYSQNEETALGYTTQDNENYIEIGSTNVLENKTGNYKLHFKFNPVMYDATGKMSNKITGSIKLSLFGFEGLMDLNSSSLNNSADEKSYTLSSGKLYALTVAHKILIGKAEILTIIKPITMSMNNIDSKINGVNLESEQIDKPFALDLFDVKIVAKQKIGQVDVIIGFETPLVRTLNKPQQVDANLRKPLNLFASIGTEKIAIQGFYDEKVSSGSGGVCSSMVSQGVSLFNRIQETPFYLKTTLGTMEFREFSGSEITKTSGQAPCVMVGFGFDFYKL